MTTVLDAPGAPPAPRARRRLELAGCVLAGLLVAIALPPWGWWPAAIAGIALFERLLAEQPARRRFARGWLFGVAWLAPGMAWMWFLTAPGYVAATAIFGAYLGTAAALAPRGRGWAVGLPAALTLAEAIRFCFPFGGVPLATLAISQSAGPLIGLGRLGGPLLITWVTFQLGVSAGRYVHIAHWRPLTARTAAVAHAPVAVVAGLLALAAVAPHGEATGRSIRTAIVQGGGPQGTRAVNTDPRTVVERHLAATRTIPTGAPVDLVVWPENVIDVPHFATSQEHAEVAEEASRLGVPFVVGVTEDSPQGDAFLNAQVVVLPDGTISSRYDKVRRVPFGEYMPLRGLLHALGAPTDLVPRDAVAGTGPGYVDTPAGRLGVVISWEVFFGGRGRDGVGKGGLAILNPTNGSSYTGTILQTQQIASSRLRAVENGRWVVQVSPTGFSAFVTPAGKVLERTSVGEQAVRYATVELRRGRTIYNRIGDLPVVFAAAAALFATSLLGRRGDVEAPAGQRVRGPRGSRSPDRR